jgi:DNA polymerase-3 subunit delta
MNLAPAQLQEHLKRGLKSLYTLHGDEPLLVQEFADALRAAAREQGYTERTVHTVAGAHFDWSEVLASGGSLSLFADKQIVEIRIPSGKPGKDGRSRCSRSPSARRATTTLTLVMLPRLDSMTAKGAWFGALESFGVTVKFDPIDRRNLPQWIAQRLQQQGQRVAAGEEGQRTLQFFADRVEGNLLAAHQEIQKLGLLHPAHPAGRAPGLRPGRERRAQCGALRRLQALRGRAGRPGCARARMLDGLQAEGEAEVLVHYTLAEDIRSMKRVKDAMVPAGPCPWRCASTASGASRKNCSNACCRRSATPPWPTCCTPPTRSTASSRA